MKITPQVVLTEGIIAKLLSEVGHDWTVWHDDRDKRELHRPTYLAIHVRTGRIIGIYTRPRHLYPSELPSSAWLPPSVTPVVWHPGIRGDVRRWLAAPYDDPPGAIPTTQGNP